jgi:hypothetical protein
MVLPGRLFAYHDWGGTVDPILPSLAERPVAERMIVPFADLRAADLQIATDALISQERALPGQLVPLLRLMGVGAVVSTADDDRSRSGAVGPVEAADVLDRQAGLGRPVGIGPVRRERAAAGRVRADERLPRVAVRPVDVTPDDAIVRVLPRGPLTVVDGSADALVSLAAFGALDPSRPLAYAADLDARRIRRAAAAGGEVVISDANRRQAFVAARMRANRGPVLTAAQALSEDGAMLDPFGRGPDAQTVAVLEGIADVTAPASPQTPQAPEHRPFAALDGDPATAWIADRALAKDRHWLEVRFTAPRDVGVVEILPYGDERGRPLVLDVAGRRVRVRAGWNRVRVDRRGLRALRVRIVEATQPVGGTGGTGGIAELRIPGVRARELLRPPVLAERALAGRPVRGPLTYLLSRVTTDAPLRTAPPVGPFQTRLLRDRVDPEPRLARTIAPPVARAWTLDAWTAPAPETADDVLDRLAGTTGTVRATSSGREGGLAAHRASRAFDGDRATAWIAPWVDGGRGGPRPSASLAFTLERPATVRRLRLVPPAETVRRPTRVRVRAGSGAATTVVVAPSGEVVLPRPLRGRAFAIEVVAARFPAGTPGVERRRRAVGIAEIEGVPGARVRDPAGDAPLRGRCGDAAVRTAAGVVALRPSGTVAAFQDDRPLRARACGGPVALPAGRQEVHGLDGVLQVDHLRLRSVPGDAGVAARAEGHGDGGGGAAAGRAGRVLDQGRGGQGARDGVRVAVDRPGWLVLGESYNPGWRARCDGRDLGEPVPMQGFANAWPVEPGCRQVAFTWTPNRWLRPAYLVSLVACAALLVLLAVTARRRRAAVAAPRPLLPDDEPVRRWPWRPALAGGLAAGVVLGFVFAIRAGVVIGPAVALILRHGVPARTLALAGGALLGLVVPVLSLAVPVDNPGGYNSNLAVERIAAHWVGVAAVVLIGAAVWRTCAAARRRAR